MTLALHGTLISKWCEEDGCLMTKHMTANLFISFESSKILNDGEGFIENNQIGIILVHSEKVLANC